MRAPRWLIVISLVLASFGGAARFYSLGAKPVWYDEWATLRTCLGYTRPALTDLIYAQPVLAGELSERIWSAPKKPAADVVRVLATADPNHTPFYYLTNRIWMDLVGWSPSGMRSLSAVFGLTTMAAAFLAGLWIAGPAAGFVLLALVSISPIHLVYSQEAREYTLWCTFLFLWTGLFARALERDDRRSWIAYGACTAAAMWAHPLSGLVAAAQFVAVALARRDAFWRYAAAATPGGLGFLPWVVVYVAQGRVAGKNVDWMEAGMTFQQRLDAISAIFARPFLDIYDGRIVALNVAVGAAAIGAGVWGVRGMAKPQRTAVLATFFSVIGAFAVADVLDGGRRSTIGRFQFPSVVGLFIAIACALSRRRPAGLVTGLAVFAVAGLISFNAYFAADSWWIKGRIKKHREVAATIAAMGPAGSVIATVPNVPNPYQLLSLAPFLDPSTPVGLLVRKNPAPALPRPVYVVFPDGRMIDRLRAAGAERKSDLLWIVERESPL